MKLKFFLFILTVFFSINFYGQNLVLWNANEPLTVEDFMAEPDTNSRFKALSEIGIGLEAKGDSKSIEWKVTCSFNKDKSWMVDSAGPQLLKHEQVHFDICEINVRKLRQQLEKLTSMPEKKELEDLLQNANKLDIEMQRRYDYETDHGIKATKQYEWEEYVERELKKLEKYAG